MTEIATHCLRHSEQHIDPHLSKVQREHHHVEVVLSRIIAKMHVNNEHAHTRYLDWENDDAERGWH